METLEKPLISLKQLPKLPATYRELIIDISSLPYPIGHWDIATSCEAIGQVLNDIYKMMGAKDSVDEGAIADIITWIRFNYGSLHPVELKVAYDMYLSKNLDVQYMGSGLNKNNLAKLFNTYIDYKRRLLNSLNKSKVEAPKKDESPEKLREKHIEFLKTVVNFYERYKQGTHNKMDYMYFGSYDALLKYKLIDSEVDEALMEKAKAIFRARHLAERNGATTMPTGESLLQAEKSVYKELKVLRTFEELHFGETDLLKYFMERVR